MAYYNQERKKSVEPKVKKLLKDYGLKGSLSVNHHSSVVLTIREGSIDFIKNYLGVLGNRSLRQPENCQLADQAQRQQNINYLSVNTSWYHEHFSGKALDFLTKVLAILNEGNHNRSDIMSDYFDVGWYVDIHIGRWDKPYKYVKKNKIVKSVKMTDGRKINFISVFNNSVEV
jgi:hypothetical protein